MKILVELNSILSVATRFLVLAAQFRVKRQERERVFPRPRWPSFP